MLRCTDGCAFGSWNSIRKVVWIHMEIYPDPDCPRLPSPSADYLVLIVRFLKLRTGDLLRQPVLNVR